MSDMKNAILDVQALQNIDALTEEALSQKAISEEAPVKRVR